MAVVRWNQGGRRVPTAQAPSDDGECFYEDDFSHDARPWWQGRGRRPAPAVNTLRVDVANTAKEVVVRADVPGVEKEDLEVTITNDMVIIKGERKDLLESSTECFYCREAAFGAFERQIQLPEAVLNDKADAALKNGVLTLTIPKAEPKGAVRIKVS